jgi:hypothetical protein
MRPAREGNTGLILAGLVGLIGGLAIACAEGEPGPGDNSERVPRAASGGVCDGVPNGQQAPGCDANGDCSRDICMEGECTQGLLNGSCTVDGHPGHCKNGDCDTGSSCADRCSNEERECLAVCLNDRNESCECFCEQKFNWCMGGCGEPGDQPAQCPFAATPRPDPRIGAAPRGASGGVVDLASRPTVTRSGLGGEGVRRPILPTSSD